jgi:hypothetical protein
VPNEPRKYPIPDVKILWGFAAARCAFPSCRLECVEPPTLSDGAVVIGKIAHIVAHGDKGPRADPSLPIEQRDCYDNWVLLCGRHHDIVDGQPSTYTIAELRGWKVDHENWVRQQLTVAMPAIGFAELEVITKGILATSLPPDASFLLTPPRAKILRNGFSAQLDIYFNMGMSKAKEVADFVSHVSIIDANFPEQLKAGFVQKYDALKKSGLEGDALFESLHEFASGGSNAFARQAAGLAVLLYLFEKCEIFEQ